VCLLSPNLHPNKQKYKNENETLYFIIKNNNNNRKHIKINNKKDKSF
jgi:negative regulator of replication initiation